MLTRHTVVTTDGEHGQFTQTCATWRNPDHDSSDRVDDPVAVGVRESHDTYRSTDGGRMGVG